MVPTMLRLPPKLPITLLLTLLLAACSTTPIERSEAPSGKTTIAQPVSRHSPLAATTPQAQEVVMFALSLLDTGYRFGGKNPSAGLDCSGMVSYVFQQAAGLRLSGSAADIARSGKNIDREQLRPGDLVFFNTRNQPYSHVGIYLGDERFVHAPNANGKVRIDLLNTPYYTLRFESGRSYFN